MNRRGAILPVTLVLLAISATVMAQVCRRGMFDALGTTQEAQELQRRWAIQSCQTTLLPRAGAILNAAEKSARGPVPDVESTVVIGGQLYLLRFADEQSKVNVNLMFALKGSTGVQSMARDAVRRRSNAIAVRLRPLAAASRTTSSSESPLAFVSPGQLFDERGGEGLSVAAAMQELTCWGGGKLNWRRASARSLRVLLPGDDRTVSQILALQRAGPSANLADLAKAASTAEGRTKFDDWFTDGSTSQSLWILAPDGRARLAIREMKDNGRTSVICFDW